MTTSRRLRRHRLASWALAGAALATGCMLPAAAEPVPLGPEVSLDPTPAFYYRCLALAGRDNGSFAAAWARVHERSETEVVVRTAGAGGALDPARDVWQQIHQIDLVRVAADPAGYTVLWKDYDGVRNAYFASERDADGASLDEPIDLGRSALDVSPRPGGGFVASWISARNTLNVQLLDAQGGRAGRPVKTSVGRAYSPSAVHSADGQFVVFWYELGDRIGSTLVARRFDVLGRPQGRAVQLVPSVVAGGRFTIFNLALGDDGTLAVLYRIEPEGNEGGPTQLLVRTWNASGRPLQPPITVAAAHSVQFSFDPGGVAVDAAGNTLFLWTRFGAAPTATFAAVLPRGAHTVEPFAFASAASGIFNHVTCAAAAAAGDSWIIAWQANDQGAGDGRPDFRLFARRFRR